MLKIEARGDTLHVSNRLTLNRVVALPLALMMPAAGLIFMITPAIRGDAGAGVMVRMGIEGLLLIGLSAVFMSVVWRRDAELNRATRTLRRVHYRVLARSKVLGSEPLTDVVRTGVFFVPGGNYWFVDLVQRDGTRIQLAAVYKSSQFATTVPPNVMAYAQTIGDFLGIPHTR